VKTNVFLTTMDDFAVMNEEYAKVFAMDPPARSAIAVYQLPLGGLVEIEAWVLPRSLSGDSPHNLESGRVSC